MRSKVRRKAWGIRPGDAPATDVAKTPRRVPYFTRRSLGFVTMFWKIWVNTAS